MTTPGNPVTEVVAAFNEAWSAHDLEAALAMLTEDCVFDATNPPPDGESFTGPAAIREAWAPIFADRATTFTVENMLAGDDHVVQQWRYDWGDGHVRGVDVFRVRGGRIAAKLSYVKG